MWARNIAYLRQKKGLKTEELARELHIPPYLLVFYEKQIAEPTLSELIKLASFFNIPLDILVFKNIEQAEQLKENIQFLVMDIDGVLTDGGMYYDSSGKELKKFNTKDGRGILNLKSKGIKTAFLSSGFNESPGSIRAQVLKVDRYYIGPGPKLKILQEWWKELAISPAQTAYIGDDINDLEVIDAVGFSACPADAVDMIKSKVNVILSKNGGEGCVREFIDLYL